MISVVLLVTLYGSDEFQMNSNHDYNFMIINMIWRFFIWYEKLQLGKCGINKSLLMIWLFLIRIQHINSPVTILLFTFFFNHCTTLTEVGNCMFHPQDHSYAKKKNSTWRYSSQIQAD